MASARSWRPGTSVPWRCCGWRATRLQPAKPAPANGRNSMRALALIDGEHYPAVTRDALEVLRQREGLEFVGAVFLGGTEKLASSDALASLGLQIVHEPVLLRGVERGLAE